MNFDILVVDDSKAALFMFEKVIKVSGVPVGNLMTAENGKQAIDVLKQNPVDLIMTDIHMPEMDGFQLIAYLKGSEQFKHIPIIVITTEGRSKYVAKAKMMGAVDYIKKPCQPEQVKQLVLEALGVEENETIIDDFETGDF
jgi:two-component system chemotaxis response regulator CheY